jgi:hypothetical protein
VQIKDGEELRIQEQFLEFLPAEQTFGEELTKDIFQELRKYSIPLENVRGQAYDNASNMKGKRSGAQHNNLCVNPRAFFIPRNSHSLNLDVNDAAMSSRHAFSFFWCGAKDLGFSECISPSLVSNAEACYPTRRKTFE